MRTILNKVQTSHEIKVGEYLNIDFSHSFTIDAELVRQLRNGKIFKHGEMWVYRRSDGKYFLEEMLLDKIEISEYVAIILAHSIEFKHYV